MLGPAPQLPRPRLSRPTLQKLFTDGGVRRHVLGLLRSRNEAQDIIDRFYGPQGPPIAGQRPVEREHVAVPTPQADQSSSGVPGDN
jgi:hypothetical protein